MTCIRILQVSGPEVWRLSDVLKLYHQATAHLVTYSRTDESGSTNTRVAKSEAMKPCETERRAMKGNIRTDIKGIACDEV